MENSILVCGGAGYIGAHMCKQLARAGWVRDHELGKSLSSRGGAHGSALRGTSGRRPQRQPRAACARSARNPTVNSTWTDEEIIVARKAAALLQKQA